MSGDSAFQLVVWIPLANCFKSISMFVASPDSSLELLKKISEGSFDEKQVQNSISYLDINSNHFLIFPPTLIHGISFNTTDSTRISLNFRVKALFSPYHSWTPSDGLGCLLPSF
jgi:sporadic carbohydrate cluster 2OG-Fe(II) oxygenase